MRYKYNNRQFDIRRYPPTDNASLRAWNAADEHILQFLEDQAVQDKHIAIYNDRFGFISCLLHGNKPTTIITYQSQNKACLANFNRNGVDDETVAFLNPLFKATKEIDIAVVKLPKSLELFKLYLQHISKNAAKDIQVICGFMTRHFTGQLLSIAADFFHDVSQSRAHKKSRLLFLKNPKPYQQRPITKCIETPDWGTIEQYFGVFSSSKIDPATQFLIENLDLKETDQNVLDLGSGCGILAKVVSNRNPDSAVYLLDDSYLAIESSKLNLSKDNIHFYFNDDLEPFEKEQFDFVVSNPPFHFEYEINIDVSIGLFSQVARCLKPKGRFQLVANHHLNYKTHLKKCFNTVAVTAKNKKFVIYTCQK